MIKKKEDGYAKQTLSIMKGIFNKAFSMAVYPYEFLKTDPSQFVKVPKYDQKEWKDIVIEEETLSVERIMIQDGKSWIMGTPKTQSSYRTIQIGPSLVALLKKAKVRQKENKMFYGQYYNNTDFICTKENGDPVTLNSIKWYTQKYRESSGVNFNFHSFRHTHATMLLENGAKPKGIQQRLRHSRLSTTMDTYAHVTKKMKKETVDIFESIMTKEA